MPTNHADLIREFVYKTYVAPAKNAGKAEVEVRAGDVHSAMKLKDRMPAIASALGAKTFESTYGVQCLSRTGPHNGANLVFKFRV